jgi:hypothetical protein
MLKREPAHGAYNGCGAGGFRPNLLALSVVISHK